LHADRSEERVGQETLFHLEMITKSDKKARKQALGQDFWAWVEGQALILQEI
jgi:hypothetical protein